MLLLIIGLNLIQPAKAQLLFTKAPQQGAFFAQDKSTSSATIDIEGFVDNPIYSHLEIQVIKNGFIEHKHQISLTFSGGKAQFKKSILLKTGKHFYTIKYELSGGGSYSEQVDEICVGDVYLVQGQSNAVASSFNPFDTKYNDPYLRSFGSSSPNANTCLADTAWHGINASSVYSPGSVGQWAGVMAKHLLDSFHTPICLLNGAVGGTRIDQHQPTLGNHENLYSIYGRLLYRVRKANLDSNISGILYFQGESDGSNDVKHDTMFTNLHNFWTKDYPGFKKLYVVQVRDGCGSPSLQLREVQRQFEFNLPNCQTVSANGLNNHDGCHYGFKDGYEKLGMQMSKLVGRDFYWSTQRTNINPPNIKSCYYSNGKQTEITINLTEPSDLLYIDKNFETLFKIEGDNSVSIVNGKVSNNKIVLTLNKSSCQITGLSYDGLRGSQPWVKNSIDFGLISFYNIPIQNHNVKDSLFFCKNIPNIIGTSALQGIRYELKQLSNGKVYKTSQLKIPLLRDDSFMLIMAFDSLACPLKDSVVIHVKVDKVMVPHLGKDTAICQGKSLTFAPIKNGFFQFQWEVNGKMNRDFSIAVDSTALINLSAYSYNNCEYTSNVNVVLRAPLIPIDKTYYSCSGTSTPIKLVDTFKSYFWNTLKGISSNNFELGSHTVTVIDSFGCIAYDSFTISNYPILSVPKIQDTLCEGNALKVLKPVHFKHWYKNHEELGDFIILFGNNTVPLLLEDSNHCEYFDTIKTRLFEPIKFPTSIDTTICLGDVYKFYMPPNMKEYSINNAIQIDSIFYYSHAKEFTYKITDKNSCHLSGVFKLKENSLPDISWFKDTTLCANDSLPIALNEGIKAFVNFSLVSTDFHLKPGFAYLIKLINTKHCEAVKSIYIASIDCSSSALNLKDPNISIFPNPATDKITVKSNTNIDDFISLYDANGKLIISTNLDGNNSIDIKVSSFHSGIYFLRSSKGIWKIIKE